MVKVTIEYPTICIVIYGNTNSSAASKSTTKRTFRFVEIRRFTLGHTFLSHFFLSLSYLRSHFLSLSLFAFNIPKLSLSLPLFPFPKVPLLMQIYGRFHPCFSWKAIYAFLNCKSNVCYKQIFTIVVEFG